MKNAPEKIQMSYKTISEVFASLNHNTESDRALYKGVDKSSLRGAHRGQRMKYRLLILNPYKKVS